MKAQNDIDLVLLQHVYAVIDKGEKVSTDRR